MSRLLRVILFVILVLLLLLIGFRCSQQAPQVDQAGLLEGAKQTADSVSDAAKTGADVVGDAAGGAMDAAKAGADAVGDAADGAMDAAKAGADALVDAAGGAMDAAKAGADAVGDAAGGAMDAAKVGADAVGDAMGGGSGGDSLNATAHSVIADGIKTVVDWAKSTPSTSDSADSAATDSADTNAAATAAAAVTTAATTATASATTDSDSLNSTAHSVIADGINTVVAWAKGGGKTPEAAAAPEAATAAPSPAPASAPAKTATTEVSAKTMSAGSSIRLDGVNFASGSDTLVGNSKSLLDNVAKVLAEKGDVKVEVAGYTDSTGNAALNKSLSQQRAAKVKAYLASKGIAAERMTAVGYGQESPIADNTTAAGRKANRRVELHVK